MRRLLDLPYVREYRDTDFVAIGRMFEAQGLEYAAPDFNHPRFALKLVVEDQQGHVDMAFGARMTTEIFMLMDPASGDSADRWQKFLALHRVGQQRLYAMGFEDTHCWLPPQLARHGKRKDGLGRFARRLASLGWQRDDAWTPFVKYLRG